MAEIKSGQFAIATAGSAAQGPDVSGAVFVRALSTNTGNVFVGNDGANDVTSANGYELAPGEALPFVVKSLKDYFFDAATNGDKFCWIRAG